MLLGLYYQMAAFVPRNSTPDRQKAALNIHPDDFQSPGGSFDSARSSGHSHSFQRVLGEPLADGTAVSCDVMVSMAMRHSGKTVPLHYSGKTFSFGHTGNLDHIPGNKYRNIQLVAPLNFLVIYGQGPEFLQKSQIAQILKMPLHGLGDLSLGTASDLNAFVAVFIFAFYLNNGVRFHFYNGNRDDRAVVLENLRHP